MPAGGLARLPRITANAGQLGQQPRGFTSSFPCCPTPLDAFFKDGSIQVGRT